jgi:hypothetical protein
VKRAIEKRRPLSKNVSSSLLQKNESSGVNNSQVMLRVNAADIEGEPPCIPIRTFLEVERFCRADDQKGKKENKIQDAWKHGRK